MCLACSNFNLYHNCDKPSRFTFFKDIFSLRIGTLAWAKPRSAAPTDHMKVGLGCICRALALMHAEWGLGQVHRIWALICWKCLAQVFRFCVGGLTGERESHVKLRGIGLLFCASGWSIAHILLSVPITQILLITQLLLLFLFPPCSLLISTRVARGAFPLNELCAVPGDTLSWYCVGMNGRRGPFVPTPRNQEWMIHSWIANAQA